LIITIKIKKDYQKQQQTIMGLCGSQASAEFKQSAERDRKLQEINKKTWTVEQSKIKLLLLGAGESGKSTIFKQMKILYGNKFPIEERQQQVTVVHSNILGNIRLLLGACPKFVPLGDASLEKEFNQIPDSEETVMDPKMGELLKKIWQDPGAVGTWARKSEYHIQDSLSWYMENIDRISAVGYVPSVDDSTFFLFLLRPQTQQLTLSHTQYYEHVFAHPVS
jgi:hypothetical protein